MSVDIKLKHSSTASRVPVSGDLVNGELALNLADEKIYMKNADGDVVQVAGPGNDYGEYVKIAGDTMTGPLYLQQSNLASFSIGQDIDGTGQDHLGVYYGTTIDSTASADVFTSNGDLRIRVDGNGSATGGTISLHSGFSSTDGTITFDPSDGSATYQGRLDVGTDVSATGQYISLQPTGVQTIRYNGADADVVFNIADSGGNNVEITKGGSATFAGTAAFGEYRPFSFTPTGEGVGVFANGTINIVSYNADNERNVFEIYNTTGSDVAPATEPTVSITNDGSAEFKGDVAIGDSGAAFNILGDAIALLPPTIAEQFANIISSLPVAQPFTGDPTTLPADIPTPLKDALVRVTTAGKINLNSDGSATFAGSVKTQIPGQDAYTQVAENGGLLIYGQRSGEGKKNQVFLSNDGDAKFNGDIIQKNWDNDGTGGVRITSGSSIGQIQLKGNGSSTDVAISVREDGNSTSDDVVSIKADGSAEFTGGVSVKATGTIDAFRAFDGSSRNVKIQSNGKAEFGQINSAPGIILDGTNGSATFSNIIYSKSDIRVSATGDQIGNTSTKTGVTLYSGGPIRSAGATDNSIILQGMKSDGNAATTEIFADGDYYFAGTGTFRNAIFNLETENEDNYTTTTEEYTETIQVPVENGVATADLVNGAPEQQYTEQTVTKTREIKTYTGPTMDVKQTLLDITGALESLKAAAASATTIAELRNAIETSLANI